MVVVVVVGHEWSILISSPCVMATGHAPPISVMISLESVTGVAAVAANGEVNGTATVAATCGVAGDTGVTAVTSTSGVAGVAAVAATGGIAGIDAVAATGGVALTERWGMFVCCICCYLWGHWGR